MTFGTNLLLAILWAALIGPFTPGNLLFGFALGYLILRLCSRQEDRPVYVRRATGVLALGAFIVYELVIANVRVASYTMGRLGDLKPAILEVPIELGSTDTEITLLSTLITLTPGTLTVDVAPDRSSLFIHFMHVDDPVRAIEDIKQGFERRVLEVTR